MMKNWMALILVLVTFLACENKQTDQWTYSEQEKAAFTDSIPKSIPIMIDTVLNGVEFKLSYFAPGVKGRTIWGGLVPYDKVWVTGAHNATNFMFDQDVLFGSDTVKAGRYALFTIPGKDEWTFIINSNYRQHLADDYAESEDIVRIKTKPITTQGEWSERLQYQLWALDQEKMAITIQWEQVYLQVPFSVIR